MPEYRLSLTRILPYKDRIVICLLRQENTGQWKQELWHILRSIYEKPKHAVFVILSMKLQQNILLQKILF